MVGLMRGADIYALSSDYEGWGRVLIESMAVGLPVVTTDVGCAGEVLIDGRHGIVVPTRNSEAFTQALTLLAKDADMRKKYGTQAQHDVKVHVIDESGYAQKWITAFSVCMR